MRKTNLFTLLATGVLTLGFAGCNTETIEQHVHTFSEKWSYNEAYHWHAATCGHTEEVNNKEEHTLSDWVSDESKHLKVCSVCNVAVVETNHIYDEWIIENESTEYSDGLKWHTCKICNYKETQTIPALGHTFSKEWSYNEAYHWHAATCGHTDEKSDETMHTFGEWITTAEATFFKEGEETRICPVCGYNETVKFYWTDGTQTVKGGVLIKCEKNAQKVTIPKGVTSIGDSAFYDCENLDSVTIPDGVTSIGDGAFSGCKSLDSVAIPDGVTSIGDDAFYGCKSLDSVAIPDGVTSIGDYAFYGCSYLRSTTIPKSVTSIGTYAFFGCSVALSSVTIPDGVTSIRSHTFSGCKGLYSVTIPDSVTSIEDFAFSDCTSIYFRYITFNGTIAQWNNVKKDSHWKTNCTELLKTVKCKDGNVTL